MQFAADDWSGRFSAVTASRNLLAHHPSVFDGVEGEGGGVEESRLLDVVVPLLVSAVSAKRSVLRMNGLRCEAELFRYVCVRRQILASIAKVYFVPYVFHLAGMAPCVPKYRVS